MKSLLTWIYNLLSFHWYLYKCVCEKECWCINTLILAEVPVYVRSRIGSVAVKWFRNPKVKQMKLISKKCLFYNFHCQMNVCSFSLVCQGSFLAWYQLQRVKMFFHWYESHIEGKKPPKTEEILFVPVKKCYENLKNLCKEEKKMVNEIAISKTTVFLLY